jgi:hypothetical protein
MGRLPRAVAPALATVLGAVIGIVAALVLQWQVIQPSDDELLAAAEAVTPTGFVAVGEPVISGAWAPSLTRGVAHVDASAWTVVTLGEVADELRASGWDVREVDAAAVQGNVEARRGRLATTVYLSPREEGPPGWASISVRRSSDEPPLGVAVSVGAVIGAGLGTGSVLAGRRTGWRRRSRTRLRHR